MKIISITALIAALPKNSNQELKVKSALPLRTGLLTIAMDGEFAGRKAGLALAKRADAIGWKASLLEATDGRDWNDILFEGGLI
ncbi:toprim domain-containing protein [Litoreibacter ponti]|uniref:toprim domain-containing protein n=1 Tax=Litoreibacter ponti TaxID=1510457 RepID=UPI001FEA40FB|nr:toprim domain-containing protein [Litoreibacter ponti]